MKLILLIILLSLFIIGSVVPEKFVPFNSFDLIGKKSSIPVKPLDIKPVIADASLGNLKTSPIADDENLMHSVKGAVYRVISENYPNISVKFIPVYQGYTLQNDPDTNLYNAVVILEGNEKYWESWDITFTSSVKERKILFFQKQSTTEYSMTPYEKGLELFIIKNRLGLFWPYPTTYDEIGMKYTLRTDFKKLWGFDKLEEKLKQNS